MQYDELKEHIKQAMKAHDKVRLSILRQVHGEIKNIETLEGSIKAGNNQERTDTLTAQVKMLEELLPQQLAGEQLSALIDAVLSETGATTKKEMGRVMGELTKRTGGNFDKAAAAKELQGKLA